MIKLDKIKHTIGGIYRSLINKKKRWEAKRRFCRYLRIKGRKRAMIIGSPVYTNLGDSAIFLAERQFLKTCGYKESEIKEVTYTEFYSYRDIIRKKLKQNEPIYGLGGGNMGNQWPEEEKIRYDLIRDYPENPIIVFPQTIHFLEHSEEAVAVSQAYYNRKKNLILIAREKESEKIMQSLYPDATVLLSPDIVLSAVMEDFGAIVTERTGVLLVARNDPEKAVNDEVWQILKTEVKKLGLHLAQTDMYADTPVTKENRRELVRKKMQEYCRAELVITDRLHGMVFAALTGTPCIVFSNYNHKVKGTYDWISYLPYIQYVETAEEAIKLIPELLSMKNCRYDNTPLLPNYDKLAEIIREYSRE